MILPVGMFWGGVFMLILYTLSVFVIIMNYSMAKSLDHIYLNMLQEGGGTW